MVFGFCLKPETSQTTRTDWCNVSGYGYVNITIFNRNTTSGRQKQIAITANRKRVDRQKKNVLIRPIYAIKLPRFVIVKNYEFLVFLKSF